MNIIETETLELPTIDVGDTVLVGRWKTKKATIKGFTADNHNQPVLKTNKGNQKLFKPRITKLEESRAMTHVRKYIDLLSENIAAETSFIHRLYEGEFIPLPQRVLRIAGSPLDFYQLLKMVVNPNLSHKVNYKPVVSKGGANITDIMMVFYDEVSFEQAKKLFDHYGIAYEDGPEVWHKKITPYKSITNPPTDADDLYGEAIR